MLLLMKWMVYLHPGLAAILTGAGDASLSSPAESLPDAPENAVDPACILAAYSISTRTGFTMRR